MEPSREGGGLTHEITPLVLTRNEAPNIQRCLDRLTWATRVVVLDSGSTDETVALARRYPNVDVRIRAFDDHASQWNHGLSLVATPWVLSLDADYVVPESFPAEAAPLIAQGDLDAVVVRFRYVIHGRALRRSLYPPRAVLFRPAHCRYHNDGHTQRLQIRGRSLMLESAFDHDDRKPFRRWLEAQRRYTDLEARKLRATPVANLSPQDRLRRMVVFGPPAVFLYTFLFKGAIFDGQAGWTYTFQRTLAEMMLSRALLRARPESDSRQTSP